MTDKYTPTKEDIRNNYAFLRVEADNPYREVVE